MKNSWGCFLTVSSILLGIAVTSVSAASPRQASEADRQAEFQIGSSLAPAGIPRGGDWNPQASATSLSDQAVRQVDYAPAMAPAAGPAPTAPYAGPRPFAPSNGMSGPPAYMAGLGPGLPPQMAMGAPGFAPNAPYPATGMGGMLPPQAYGPPGMPYAAPPGAGGPAGYMAATSFAQPEPFPSMPPAAMPPMHGYPNAMGPGAMYGMPGGMAPAPGMMQGPAELMPGGPIYGSEYGADYGKGGGVCPHCGGGGCEFCSGLGGGLLAGMLSHLLPYGEGGCCAPRWFDVSADIMYLNRDPVSRRVDFTSLGQGSADIVLSTDNLEFQDEAGLRFTGAYQVFAGSNVEFTYFGLFNWATSASVADDNGDLFSSLTNFGTAPPGGFPQTDNSVFQSIGYSSTLDNFELNFRKRFTAPNCRVQYSWLVGVRYLYLLEDFDYFTQGEDAAAGIMDYSIRARNSLTGFQLGGDLWTCIVPGVKAGGEFKAGVYGNYANQNTVIRATEPDALFVETIDMNDLAFISDANLVVIWRVNANWTIRMGYNFLYLDGVALAPEQYNDSSPPNVIAPLARGVQANDNGHAFYHGANFGFEWMW